MVTWPLVGNEAEAMHAPPPPKRKLLRNYIKIVQRKYIRNIDTKT
jgi:hypothetical protein